jgi:hypothetical protein
MEAAMSEPVGTRVPSQVDHLQEVRPVSAVQGHDLCADIHLALSVAEAVLTSRDMRVADAPDAESGATLLRELRALGVDAVAPQLVAMVALVDTAVNRLADAGAMSANDAWAEIRKDVLRKNCQSPDIL